MVRRGDLRRGGVHVEDASCKGRLRKITRGMKRRVEEVVDEDPKLSL